MSAFCCYFYFGGNKGTIIQRRPAGVVITRPTRLVSLLPMPPTGFCCWACVEPCVFAASVRRRQFSKGSGQDRCSESQENIPNVTDEGPLLRLGRFPSPRFCRLSIMSGSSRPQYFFDTSFYDDCCEQPSQSTIYLLT